MRKLRYIILIFTILFSINVYSYDLNRNVCEKFELAEALDNEQIKNVACFNDYLSASNKMKEIDNNNLFIMERISGKMVVIDAKLALVYLDKGNVNKYIYSSSSLTTSITYMNNYYIYGAADGAFLGFNYANHAIKIKISGVTGWIKNDTYTIVPLKFVNFSSSYNVTNNDISHTYVRYINVSADWSLSLKIGPKPSFLEVSKYYSYDGIYFYKSLDTMLIDYKNNTYDNSVNKDNPYYNYYIYLPHRSRTNYNILDMDVYLRNVLGFKGSVYGKVYLTGYSTLFSQSDFYFNNEKMFGANALMVFSLARNESDSGRSTIAASKNNLFGHKAYDSSPFASAEGYLDVRSSIYNHGYSYVNYGYSEVSDSRYNGGHFGNKNSGFNVQYASDPYWGEKAASYYYRFDKDNGMIDYNYYQLAISTNSKINARVKPNTGSKALYTYKANVPVIILEEVEGETVNGTNIWYKVQSDSNLTSDGMGILPSDSTHPHYNWNSYVYVHSSYFKKINAAKENKEELSEFSCEYKSYADEKKHNPIVGQLLNNTDYYYTSMLINKRGTALKGAYVTILEKIECKDSTKYMIITDYSTSQKGFIDAKNVKIVSKDLMGYVNSTSNSKINIYDKVGGSVIGSIYTDNYLPIIDGNKDNLKVQFKLNPLTYGYVSTSSATSYSLNNINHAPVIEGTDTQILINSEVDYKSFVKAKDIEDGDITNKIIIESNNVNPKKAGIYTITYSVTDSYGVTVSKTIKVEVFNYSNSNSLFMFDSFTHLENNKFTVSGFLGVKGMDNINVSNTLIFVNQVTKEEYRFKLNKWTDFPYEMSSLDDKVSYKYNDGWFKDIVDLSSIPKGDYTIYIECINNKYITKTLFTNISYAPLSRRVINENRSYAIDIDWASSGSPINLVIRDNLIGNSIPETYDNMFNFFNKFELNNNKLKLKGTSHNYGINYGINSNVVREIVFENIRTFERYSYNLDSITNGDYVVTLPKSDNCDKTRAWFDKEITLNLPVGDYALYIRNKVAGTDFYGELIDISYTNFANINNSKYVFSRNDNLRLRVELKVKSA